LMDLAMPRLSGLDALRELAKTPTPVRILVLAEVVEKDQMVKALQLGARGVVLKESATQILLESIWSVKRGQYWVGRESVPSLVQALRDFYPRVKDEQRRNFNLTPRELQTVAAVTAGYTNKGIALKFSLSEQTVKHHLTSIFSKLSVTNRLELVIFSITHRLTDGL
jgi:two-component system, NarL family, nitrate/nitrite response regulator NarL